MARKVGFRPSVRARATALASVVVGVALTLGALGLVVTLDRSLVGSDDGLNQARAHDLAVLASRGTLPGVLRNVHDQGVAQVVDESGRVLAASPNIRAAGPITTFRPEGDAPVVRTVENAPDDNETENYRVWALNVATATGRDTVYVGTSLEAVPEASRTLRRTLLVGVPVTVLLIALCTWFIIGRAFRPVEAIRSRVAGITDRALDRRVPVPPARDEVGRLAVTMNKMLDRLEVAQQRQRDFVADASHELQSPVAAIRAQIEVALAHPDRADWSSYGKDILADCEQIELLLRDLLFLAREQEGVLPLRREPLDLDDIVLEEAARTRSGTGVCVDTSQVSAGPATGSRDELRRVVRNLLENAVRHAGGSVRLTVSTMDGVTRLDVEDDGPGVAPAERDRVFDRFYRGDASRARQTGGTGLGLSIARTIAERHGGSLDMVDSDLGAHFVLMLPSGMD